MQVRSYCLSHVLRLENDVFEGWGLLGIHKPEREAIVAADRLHIKTGAFPQSGLHGDCPGAVNPASERREHTNAPVPQGVTKAFDDDVSVVGGHAGDLHLILEICHEVAGSTLITLGAMLKPVYGLGGARSQELSRQCPHCSANLDRSTQCVAMPEGDF